MFSSQVEIREEFQRVEFSVSFTESHMCSPPPMEGLKSYITHRVRSVVGGHKLARKAAPLEKKHTGEVFQSPGGSRLVLQELLTPCICSDTLEQKHTKARHQGNFPLNVSEHVGKYSSCEVSISYL